MSEIRSKDNRTSVFHASASCITITDAGHSFAHLPHPIHAFISIFAIIPFQISMAFLGHTFRQQPQATQSPVLTKAFFFFLIFFSTVRPPEFDRNSITWSWEGVCEFVTDCNIFQIIYICACCTYLEK